MREGDPRDADVLLDFLMKHRGHLRAWRPDTPQTRELRFLVEDRRQLVDEKTRCLNRRTQRFKLYFPQALSWFGNRDSLLLWKFLEQWPNPEALRKARRGRLQPFWRRIPIDGPDIEELWPAIRQAIPAQHSLARSAWTRAYYYEHRARGKQHHAITRGLAFKMDSHRLSIAVGRTAPTTMSPSYTATLARRSPAPPTSVELAWKSPAGFSKSAQFRLDLRSDVFSVSTVATSRKMHQNPHLSLKSMTLGCQGPQQIAHQLPSTFGQDLT